MCDYSGAFALFPSTGIAEMDAVHARLKAQLQATQHAVAQAPLSDVLACAVTLQMMLREDFRGEELLMSKYGYAQKTVHESLHTLIESEFVEFVRAIRDAPAPPPDGARARLLDMLASASRRLVAHVAQEDIPLACFIQAACDGTDRRCRNSRGI